MSKETKRILLQVGLFVVTFITTTLAGVEWVYGTKIYSYSESGIGFNTNFSWDDFAKGLSFSIPLLLILTVHEFGHYFVALYHKVKTSLPYYIPIPPIPVMPFTLGTMGAVIRLRSRPVSNVQNFDIGLAGPLAGFIVAVVILIYGFITLPPPEYVFQFHPEYEQYGRNYADIVYSKDYITDKQNLPPGSAVIDIEIGTNLIFWILGEIFAEPGYVPNPHEIMHYPVLLACYIALFVTCLNLLPIGQLDGGHVVYGLFGFKVHRIIAIIFFMMLIFYAGLGLPYIVPTLPKDELVTGIILYILFLYIAFTGLRISKRDRIMYALLIFAVQFALMHFIPGINGYQGWLLFGFILGRFIGVEHPPSLIEQPLNTPRVVLGWLTLLIFILCFSPAPISMNIITGE